MGSELTKVVAQAVGDAAKPLALGTEAIAKATASLPTSDVVAAGADSALRSPTFGGEPLLRAASHPSAVDAAAGALNQAVHPIEVGVNALTSPLTNQAVHGAARDAFGRLVLEPFRQATRPLIDAVAQNEPAQAVDMVQQGLEVAKVLEPAAESGLGPVGTIIDGAKIGYALADANPHQVITEGVSLIPGVGPVITTAEMIARASGVSEEALTRAEDVGVERALDAAVSDATFGLVRSTGEPGQSLMLEGMYVSADGGQTWRLRNPSGPMSDWLRHQPFGAGLLGALSGLLGKLVALIAALILTLSAAFCASSRLGNSARSGTGSFGVAIGAEPVRAQGGYSVEKSGGTVDASTSSIGTSSPAGESPGWEAALQRERLDAIIGGDSASYNRLVQEHREIYGSHGVDPCQSGFFPQGCSR